MPGLVERGNVHLPRRGVRVQAERGVPLVAREVHRKGIAIYPRVASVVARRQNEGDRFQDGKQVQNGERRPGPAVHAHHLSSKFAYTAVVGGRKRGEHRIGFRQERLQSSGSTSHSASILALMFCFYKRIEPSAVCYVKLREQETRGQNGAAYDGAPWAWTLLLT